MQRSISKSELRRFLLGAALAFSMLAVTVPAGAQGASIDSATAEQKQTASKAFEAGMKAVKHKKHDEAYAAFKNSYDAVASPNSHLMMARELVELGRLEEAWAEYEKTAAEADAAAASDKKYESAAQSARNEQNELKKKIGLLVLKVSPEPGSRVTVRGKEIPQGSWDKPVPVTPGSATVTFIAADGKETTKEVEAAAGSETPVDLAPQAATPATASSSETSGEASAKLDTSGSKPSLRTWAYVAGGVGIAGVATFAIFGLMNNAKHSKLQDNCNNGQCPADLQSDADAGKRYQTIANIGLVVGVVGLGTGTVLYLISGKQNKEKAARHVPARHGPRIDGVSLGYRSVAVSGSF
jgi:hypothetical protein